MRKISVQPPMSGHLRQGDDAAEVGVRLSSLPVRDDLDAPRSAELEQLHGCVRARGPGPAGDHLPDGVGCHSDRLGDLIDGQARGLET